MSRRNSTPAIVSFEARRLRETPLRQKNFGPYVTLSFQSWRQEINAADEHYFNKSMPNLAKLPTERSLPSRTRSRNLAVDAVSFHPFH